MKLFMNANQSILRELKLSNSAQYYAASIEEEEDEDIADSEDES